MGGVASLSRSCKLTDTYAFLQPDARASSSAKRTVWPRQAASISAAASAPHVGSSDETRQPAGGPWEGSSCRTTEVSRSSDLILCNRSGSFPSSLARRRPPASRFVSPHEEWRTHRLRPCFSLVDLVVLDMWRWRHGRQQPAQPTITLRPSSTATECRRRPLIEI